MDKKMLEELQKMQKQIADFEDRPSTLGDGLADLRNNKLPVNQLPEGVITGDVTADNVDSGAATEGQALIADGEGGAEWGTVEALPEITAGDEGKVLKVDSGAAVWGDAGSEPEPTLIDLNDITNPTIQDLFNAVGYESGILEIPSATLKFKGDGGYPFNIQGTLKIEHHAGPDYGTTITNNYVTRVEVAGKSDTYASDLLKDVFAYSNTKVYCMTANTNGLSSNTDFVLNIKNGVLSWAEASSGGGMEVLELLSSSGTLTNEQITLVSGNNCIIKYNNYIFYKQSVNEIFHRVLYLTKTQLGTGESGAGSTFQECSISTQDGSYTIDTSNVVEPNPSLSGSESNLNSVKIGGNNYKIGGGTQLYKHSFDVSFSGSNSTVIVISKTSTAYTNIGDVVNDISNVLACYLSVNHTSVQIGVVGASGLQNKLAYNSILYSGTPGSETLTTELYITNANESIIDTVIAF